MLLFFTSFYKIYCFFVCFISCIWCAIISSNLIILAYLKSSSLLCQINMASYVCRNGASYHILMKYYKYLYLIMVFRIYFYFVLLIIKQVQFTHIILGFNQPEQQSKNITPFSYLVFTGFLE